jgi:hypothetical protein
MCAEELASGALVEVLTEYTLDPMIALVVLPAGRRPKTRVFADYLEQAMTRSRTFERAHPICARVMNGTSASPRTSVKTAFRRYTRPISKGSSKSRAIYGCGRQK